MLVNFLIAFCFADVWFLTFSILMVLFVIRVHYHTVNIDLVFRQLF